MTISHSFTALARKILFLPLEHEMHIFSLYKEERWGEIDPELKRPREECSQAKR